MHDFKKLKVWKESMLFAKEIYSATSSFPKTEIYGMTNQIRRAAVSVPSNISEGAGRSTNGEFGQFLSYASGSCCELETQLTLSEMIGFLKKDEFDILLKKLTGIHKMIYKLKQTLSKS